MLEYNLDIAEHSVWIIAPQNAVARTMPFYLTELGRFYAGNGYYTKRSEKDGYYLVYTSTGCGEMDINGTTVEIPARRALLICCEQPHAYHTLSQEPWVNFWLHLDGAGLTGYAPLLSGIPIRIAQPLEFLQIFDVLEKNASAFGTAAAATISDSISSILTMMLSSHLHNESDASHHAGIEAAIHFIHKNYQSPITIEDITGAANMSKFHFVRLFGRQVGSTPYNYLIQYRISQAKRLLCTTSLPIAEIASRVGYTSESNFICQFRRLTGSTPAQFRRSNIRLEQG